MLETEEEYKAALARIELLFDASKDSPEGKELEFLILLVQKYEEEHYPIDEPEDPIEFIRIRMEVLGLEEKDMAVYFGDEETATNVLNRKEPLSLAHVRALHRGLKIPAEVLIAEAGEHDKDAA